MNRNGGQLLLVGVLLLVFSFHIHRVVFQAENDPVFSSVLPTLVLVELGEGFPEQSIHQFIDGSTFRDVINLTDREISDSLRESGRLRAVVRTGSKIDLLIKDRQINGFDSNWMSAAKRIALGIPLHPDCMSVTDWQVLPGIGEQTALKIEKNRQNNGEFVSFLNLDRVPGLGKKKLNTWNQYFFPK